MLQITEIHKIETHSNHSHVELDCLQRSSNEVIAVNSLHLVNYILLLSYMY